MRTGKLGRSWWAVLAGIAALAGTGVAVAPTLAATPNTVNVLTLPESTTVGAAEIAQTPSNVDGDWLLLNSGDVDQLNTDDGFTQETITGTSINVGEMGSVVVNAGPTDYVDDGINLLALTATSAGGLSSSTLASTSPITQTGIAVGSDRNVYVADLDGSILDCSAAGSGCSTLTVPTSFSSGGLVSGQPTALTAAGGLVWFTTIAGALGSLAPDGTFSSAYNLGMFSSDQNALVNVGANLWTVSADASAIDSVPLANPGATPTAHTLTTPAGIPDATTPFVSSLVVGADNRIWFTDVANNAVGVIDPSSGAQSEYAVPAGDSITGAISLGPAGTDTLVVPLSSDAGSSNLVGEIQSSSPIVNGPTTTFAPKPGSSGTPGNPPNTTITSGPTGDTWTETPQYAFTSTISGSTFLCSVDGAAAVPCTSPHEIGRFSAGSTHTFRVQAVSPAGIADPTPATVVVHVNATQVNTSQPCDITPFLFISDSDPLSDAEPYGCYFQFDATTPPGGVTKFCQPGTKCIFSPPACPAEASCTLTLNAGWADDDLNEPWQILAESYLYGGPGRYAGGTLDHTCTPASGKAGCVVHDTESMFGPAGTWGNCLANPGYPSSSASFGPAGDRDLRCTMTLTITPATPLGLVSVGLGPIVFLPSAGKLTVSDGATGSDAVMAHAAKNARAAFKTTTATVAAAGAVKLTLRLSSAAKASLKRHHKLTITIRMKFVPANGSPSLNRVIRTTLTEPTKRPPKCPTHQPRRRLKKKIVCLPAGASTLE